MMTIGPYEECMDSREAAEYVGLAWTTFVQNYRDKGIEPIRVAGCNWFQKPELDKFLAKRSALEQQHERVTNAMIRNHTDYQNAMMFRGQK